MSFDSLDAHRKVKKAVRKNEAKSGALSTDEKEEIRRCFDLGMDDIEIGQKVNRTPGTVKKCRETELMLLDENGVTKTELKERIIQLRLKPDWKWIRQELTGDEVPMYEHEYAKVMVALKDDLTPTDEIQVFEFARCQILKHRAMMEKKMGKDRIESLREKNTQLLSVATPTKTDLEQVETNEREISALTAAQSANSNEYKIHSDKGEKIFTMLKMSRDQRIKNLEDKKKTTYIDVLKELAQEDKLERQGKLAALRVAATKKARKKLSEPHEFADGEICHPLLTWETVD